ncbi:MAG TPA: LuxR C-terminal-related transcriptional regulator [Rhodanobacteraceae bacterium]|nr:LuxR C-terminal-related transcriptional regulator [Rhodanobacteraceae bacterium]
MTYLDPDVLNGCASAAPRAHGPTITEPTASRRYPVTPLTMRQCEVIALTGRGLRAKQVAFQLGLSVRTVEKHKQDILRKLRLRSTMELLRWYLDTRERPLGDR